MWWREALLRLHQERVFLKWDLLMFLTALDRSEAYLLYTDSTDPVFAQPYGKNPLFPKCLHLFFSLAVKTHIHPSIFNLPFCWVLDSCLSFWVSVYKCLNLVSVNLSAWANWCSNMFYSWKTSSANLEASAAVINNACGSSSSAWDAPNTPPEVFQWSRTHCSRCVWRGLELSSAALWTSRS